ncbi:hypothetical protein MGG_17640 [Pyricularia oryzae 70-15]|uniref:Uncharacterized protein n=1 Tax=Pyricularia oryzae (strain 70-15 / ATCC MYA-4617 / FGSC 8958) TaxID=242507 RepID=G4NGJ1_PYRO7|nr:uncharacterized protein MGG_17640 [Pyricularia oryzae 70-15]EHA47148.1 hypothetical protein MGG_17640 [Pyricularia oryzae 70-15]
MWSSTLIRKRQLVESAPPSPPHHYRQEKHRPAQLQDQRMLVDLTTEDTGFRCSNCRETFKSSEKCFALSGCRCACQIGTKERDGGPCPRCKEHVDDVLPLEWKQLGLERMVDAAVFS